MKGRKRLGDMLVEAGIIDKDQLGAALGRQRQWGGRLGTNLILMGFMTEDELADFLSKSMGYARVDLADKKADPEALKLVKEDVARKYDVLPLSRRTVAGRDVLDLAVGDPTNLEAIDTVAAVTRLREVPLVATERDVMSAIEYYYRGVGAKPVVGAPLTPPPMERYALMGGQTEQVFELDGSEASPAPAEAGHEDTAPAQPPPPAEEVQAPPDKQSSAPPPVQDGAMFPSPHQPARPSQLPPGVSGLEEVMRGLKETRAMVVVIAELLMEAGVIDHEEFKRRFELKKIVY